MWLVDDKGICMKGFPSGLARVGEVRLLGYGRQNPPGSDIFAFETFLLPCGSLVC